MTGGIYRPGWERQPHLDQHSHRWDIVASDQDIAYRCLLCGAPRCAVRHPDGWRCVDRLNHPADHRYANGTRTPR